MPGSFQFSRTQKNTILITVNFFAFLINMAKLWAYEIPLYLGVKLWMWLLIPVLAFNLWNPGSNKFQTLKHISLFLCTGTIFGMTLAQLIKDPTSVIFMEYIWLLIAFIGVLIHYSRSKYDIYRNS